MTAGKCRAAFAKAAVERQSHKRKTVPNVLKLGCNFFLSKSIFSFSGFSGFFNVFDVGFSMYLMWVFLFPD